MMRELIAAVVVVGYLMPSAAMGEQAVSGKSATCKQIAGKTQDDVDNVMKFCDASIPEGLGSDVQSVMAMEMLLWIKVSRPAAEAMRADRLTTERIVKTWMTNWKALSGSSSVVVTVEWNDVEIAKGETTRSRGDQVTIQ